jgi:hypothetical protein
MEDLFKEEVELSALPHRKWPGIKRRDMAELFDEFGAV